MGESFKFPKSWSFEIQVLKLVVCQQIINNFKLNGQMSLDRLKINHRSYYDLLNSAFWGWLSVESQPQNPEFRNNPENFHQCIPQVAVNQHYTLAFSPNSLQFDMHQEHFYEEINFCPGPTLGPQMIKAACMISSIRTFYFGITVPQTTCFSLRMAFFLIKGP